MANKRYYWLKLKDDFFRDKAIKKLRRIAGGDTYVIIYLKMQLLSLKSGGKLFYEGVEDDLHPLVAVVMLVPCGCAKALGTQVGEAVAFCI